MVNSRDHGSLRSKRKAITALLPYAIQQERDGQPKMLDIFLGAARVSKEWEFMWHRVGEYTGGLLREASPRAVVLVLPYIRWDWLKYRKDWIKRWAWAVSGAPDTERVAQSVVNTLLQIASKEKLLPHIPINTWSWLTKRPHLPAICLGRSVGTCAHVVKAVRELGDIEILKSYFLLVWSEWNDFSPDSSGSVADYPPSRIHRLNQVHRPVHVTDSVLSHHTYTSSDSIPNHPPSHIRGSPSSCRSFSSSNRIPSGQMSNSPNGASVRPPPPDNTPSHHSTQVADRVLSRHISIGSDSTPSSPPLHIIPIDTPTRSSPPIPIGPSIPQAQILQAQILDLPPNPVGIPTRHSSSSSNNTLNYHMPNGSDNVSDHCSLPPHSTPSRHPAYVADSISSRRTSIGSNNMPGPPLHPISIQIPQPFMQSPLLARPPPISPPFNVVTPSTPSVRMLNIRDSTRIPQHTMQPPSVIVPVNPLTGVVQGPGKPTPRGVTVLAVPSLGTPTAIQDSKWIVQPLMPPPPIGPPSGFVYVLPPPDATPSIRMLDIQDSRSDLRPPHIPNNMPSSHSSGGFFEMQISIQEDFGGIGMEHHRADLLQRLDHVIGRLDRGLEYFKQHDPGFNEVYLQRTKHQYKYLREILLETDTQSKQSYEAFDDHAPPDTHITVTRDVSPPVSVVARP